MRPRVRTVLIVLAVIVLAVFLAAGSFVLGRGGAYTDGDGHYLPITAEKSFQWVENHPAFAEFASFIQPWKDRLNLATTPHLSIRMVCAQNHMNVDSILDGFNFLLQASEDGTLLYRDFYTPEEIAADPTKDETGLIFIPGEEDAPVAFLTAGGAFKAVCLFGESMPVGSVLHQMGYNVFLFKYRVNPEADTAKETMDYQERYANEDFGRALQYIQAHQAEYGVSLEDYSVWGFSAGGRTTFLWGLDNDYGYAHYGLPAPAAMVLVYSGWYDAQFEGQYGTVPPTYMAWLPNDDVIGADNVAAIQDYIDLLKAQGTPLQEHRYYEAKHGFGEGRGTDAEGWITEAVSFWESQRAA